MKILIAPGAFKHSLSASDAAHAIARGLRRSELKTDLRLLPIADGGNGTLDAFLARGGTRIPVTVENPVGRPTPAAFGVLPDGQTAVIEMALASGLELLSPDELNPLTASTYGTGQLMRAALETGVKRMIIGMGGSATVDGGAGCIQALGVRLLDEYGNSIARGGGSLAAVRSIDRSGLDPRWQNIQIIIASDVENPAVGEQGAAAVFGPQKGASAAQVAVLEQGLTHFFTLAREQLGIDVLSVAGGGGAGALAAGLMAFFNGKIQSGIHLLLAHNHFVDELADADLVITGEGRMDDQTIYGKGPVGVARIARSHSVPTIAIVGGLQADDEVLHKAGFQAVLPITTGPMALEAALQNAPELVERAALRLGYVLKMAVFPP